MVRISKAVWDMVSQVVHKILNAVGIEVRFVRNLRAARVKSKLEREFDAWRIIEQQPFTCILDIGANEGQFARLARRIWPTALIHSFEPLPDVYSALAERFRDDPRLTPHNIGLSDMPAIQSMHHSAFSPSSSLLVMADLHCREWPQSVKHTTVDVRLERLDDWAHANQLDARGVLLIKIDVQGFELSVINGGVQTLRTATFIVLEVSFHELYQGQPLFGQIHDRLRELGFIYRGNIEQYRSRDHTRVLYADAIFENTASTVQA